MRIIFALVLSFSVLQLISPQVHAQVYNTPSAVSGYDLQPQASNNTNSYSGESTTNPQSSLTPQGTQQNVQVQPNKTLQVVGKKQPSPTENSTVRPVQWILLFLLVLVVLISPALLYFRVLYTKEKQITNDENAVINDAANTPLAAPSYATENAVISNPKSEPTHTKPKKQSNKKKTNGTVKRRKKKRS